ncbi:cell wall-binding repeat-containing protein [Rathayibacter sp. VKM Ac-2926]|uniref:cell wall-binding repeat-containing protein n=1 Tax=Rathayibacter sp. VKM Ac-2926 TaxID=2929477 RepID=UPI001FB4D709|nr:cell wall-binding repeat-containing protein [Rathayibacter sp. VKM Ac-2926]MCJ1705924.1 cell wall-binding repeat-containing protein [Rathayibacter sp. VKM Ac-2926]
MEPTIRGTITAPADVPGTHFYSVTAWGPSEEPGYAFQIGNYAEVTVESGKTADYVISDVGCDDCVVRLVEAPYGEVIPSVGDEYWNNASNLEAAQPISAGEPGGRGFDFSPSAYSFSSTRVEGSDRYGTSVAATQTFGAGVPVLYIASGASWADALSAAPAAAKQDGALLLTDPLALPSVVANEIRRLAPKRTVIVGSDATVSNAVYSQIDALVRNIERIGGTDRYDTSRKIVTDGFSSDTNGFDKVYLATGNNFPDALSVAPVAGSIGHPVLLVDGARNQLDGPTRTLLSSLNAARAVVIGQTPSISAGIENELISSGDFRYTERIGGADRYETSWLINESSWFGNLLDTTYLASGEGFADALSGSVVAASQNRPITLSRPTCVPADTVVSLKRLHIDTARVLGSELTLSRDAGNITPC